MLLLLLLMTSGGVCVGGWCQLPFIFSSVTHFLLLLKRLETSEERETEIDRKSHNTQLIDSFAAFTHTKFSFATSLLIADAAAVFIN